MNKVIFLFSLIYSFHCSAGKYVILDPGDPDLNPEKKYSKKLKPSRLRNASKIPYLLKNPTTKFERGVLKRGTRICFVGDSGNGSKRQRKVAALMSRNCDQIRHLGDIVYYIGIKDLADPLLKSRFLDIYNSIKAPMYLVMGNHDYYLDPDVWLKVSKKYPKYIFPNNYYLEIFSSSIGTRGLCFLSLDSTPFKEVDPKIGLNSPRIQRQIKWLDMMKPLMRKRCTFTMGFFHHPYLLAKKGRTKKNNQELVNDFFKQRVFKMVNFIVTGHDHYLAYYPYLPKNPLKNSKVGAFDIPQIISGSGGMLQEDSSEKRSFGKVFQTNGFVKMTLMKSTNQPSFGADFRFIDYLGKELYHFNYFK